MKKRRYYDVKFVLVIALAIIVLVNLILTLNILPREKSIEVKIINDLSCKECFDLENAIDVGGIKAKKQEVVDYKSKEGAKLIEKYNIGFVPSIVITGDTQDLNLNGFERRENDLVLTKPTPPYRELSSDKIRGLVSLTYINISCEKCASVYPLVNELKRSGIKFSSEKTVDYNSEEGRELIDKYGITAIPTIVLDAEAGLYELIAAWKNIGRVSNENYILNPFPPYFDLGEDAVKGLVEITYISDKTCNACYNVSIHKQILRGFGIFIDKENEADVSEEAGRGLLLKYNITLVPTIVLSKDADIYIRLKSIWSQVGSVEGDGSYVFRKLDAVGTHKDLSTDKIINTTI